MRIDAISIFPDFFNVLDLSLLGKAQEKSLVNFTSHNLRHWAEGKHLSVDDTPFGGGAGMVMKADVWGRAIDEILGFDSRACLAKNTDTVSDTKSLYTKKVLLIPSPSGEQFTQKMAEKFSKADQIVFACGRYEGIDSRVYQHYKSLENENFTVQEFSIGDYVLNGGEVASVVVIEAVTRLIPTMMGNPLSLVEESHCEDGLLEYPVYTRPASWKNIDVPPVLLAGNHANISRFRRNKSIEKTLKNRPDIVFKTNPSAFDLEDRKVLAKNNILLSDNGVFENVTYRKVDSCCEIEEIIDFLGENFVYMNSSELSVRVGNIDSPEQLAELLKTEDYSCFVAKAYPVSDCFGYTKAFADMKVDSSNDKAESGKIVALVVTETRKIDDKVNKSYKKAVESKDFISLKTDSQYFTYINLTNSNKNYNNSGVKEALCNYVIKNYKDKENISYIICDVLSSDKATTKFYKTLGFTKCGSAYKERRMDILALGLDELAK